MLPYVSTNLRSPGAIRTYSVRTSTQSNALSTCGDLRTPLQFIGLEQSRDHRLLPLVLVSCLQIAHILRTTDSVYVSPGNIVHPYPATNCGSTQGKICKKSSGVVLKTSKLFHQLCLTISHLFIFLDYARLFLIEQPSCFVIFIIQRFQLYSLIRFV